jgi:hypothetical protein
MNVIEQLKQRICPRLEIVENPLSTRHDIDHAKVDYSKKMLLKNMIVVPVYRNTTMIPLPYFDDRGNYYPSYAHFLDYRVMYEVMHLKKIQLVKGVYVFNHDEQFLKEIVTESFDPIHLYYEFDNEMRWKIADSDRALYEWQRSSETLIKPFLNDLEPHLENYVRLISEFKQNQTLPDSIQVPIQMERMRNILREVENYYSIKRGLNQIGDKVYNLMADRFKKIHHDVLLTERKLQKSEPDMQRVHFNNLYAIVNEFVLAQGYYFHNGLVVQSVYEDFLLHQQAHDARKDHHKRARMIAVKNTANPHVKDVQFIKNSISNIEYEKVVKSQKS